MASISGLMVRPTSAVRQSSVLSGRQRSGSDIRRKSLILHHNSTAGGLTHIAPSAAPSASQTKTYRVSSDISTMFSIKEKMENLFQLCVRVITENDTTPYVEEEMTPILKSVQTTYPIFHKQGVHYFQTFCSMQESAKKNQLLSSAFVRVPLQNFRTEWENFCKKIDFFVVLNPPPHAKEISTKFKAIRSSLDGIRQANERRKHPSPAISTCVENILALGKALAKNINELFKHQFTSFQNNLFPSFRRDVKSFLQVINESFQNEFVQSGVMLCDLHRIKANIFTDCNDIITSLKAAFIFPERMKEIQVLKDTTEGELKRIIEKLSIPFVIIKPSGESLASIEPQDVQDEDDEAQEGTYKERDEIVPLVPAEQDYIAACNRIDSFAGVIFETLETPIDYTKDSWDNLALIIEMVKDLKVKSDNQSDEIKLLRSKLLESRESAKEAEMVYTEKATILQTVADEKIDFAHQTTTKNTELAKEIELLKQMVQDERDRYRELESHGDALMLKKMIIETAKELDESASLDDLSDESLCTKYRELLYNKINEPCRRCPILEMQLDDMKHDLQRVAASKDTNATALIEMIESELNDRNAKLNDLRQQLTDYRKPITDGIYLLGGGNAAEESLQEKTTNELIEILYHSAESVITSQNAASQTFKQKEQQYIKTLRQIDTKMRYLIKREDELATIESETVSEERARIIDSISENIKLTRELIIKERKSANDHKAKTHEIEELKAQLERDICKIFGVEGDSDPVRLCQSKLQELRDEHGSRDKELQGEIKRRDDDLKALELRVSVLTSKRGSIYEMLSAIQDDKDELIKQREDIKTTAEDYARCIEIMGDTLLSDQDVSELTPSEIVPLLRDFCDKYEDLTRVLNFSEIKDIFQPVIDRLPMMDFSDPSDYLQIFANYCTSFLYAEDAIDPLLVLIDMAKNQDADGDVLVETLRKCQERLEQFQSKTQVMVFLDHLISFVLNRV